MLEFKPLELNDKPITDEFVKNEKITSSELNFTTFYIWRNLFNSAFAVSDGCLIYQTKHGSNPMSLRFPLGGGDKKAAVANCIETFGSDTRFYGMTKDYAEMLNTMFPNTFEISEMKDYFDYVYESEKLISLSGKKLHGKRNHINAFYKQYNAEFSPITSADTEFITSGYDVWYDDSDEMLVQEHSGIASIIKNFDYLGLIGEKMTVGGTLAAFTIAERLSGDTAVVHIEKANTDYKGSYTVINQHFCENYLSGFKYINREEDMGLEGLRKAKQSYCPDLLIRKYKGVIL